MPLHVTQRGANPRLPGPARAGSSCCRILAGRGDGAGINAVRAAHGLPRRPLHGDTQGGASSSSDSSRRAAALARWRAAMLSAEFARLGGARPPGAGACAECEHARAGAAHCRRRRHTAAPHDPLACGAACPIPLQRAADFDAPDVLRAVFGVPALAARRLGPEGAAAVVGSGAAAEAGAAGTGDGGGGGDAAAGARRRKRKRKEKGQAAEEEAGEAPKPAEGWWRAFPQVRRARDGEDDEEEAARRLCAGPALRVRRNKEGLGAWALVVPAKKKKKRRSSGG